LLLGMSPLRAWWKRVAQEPVPGVPLDRGAIGPAPK